MSSPSREKRINIPLLPDTPNPARRIPVIARKARKGRRGDPVGGVVRDAKVFGWIATPLRVSQ